MRAKMKLTLTRLLASALLLTFLHASTMLGQSLSYTASASLPLSKDGVGDFLEIIGDDKDNVYIASMTGKLMFQNLKIEIFDKKTMAIKGELLFDRTADNYVSRCFVHEGKIYVLRIEKPSENQILTCEILDTNFHVLAAKKTLHTYALPLERTGLNIKNTTGKQLIISVVNSITSVEDNTVSFRCLFFDDKLEEMRNKVLPMNNPLDLPGVKHESILFDTKLF